MLTSPVLGLRISRAALVVLSKVPKPISCTLFPAATSSMTTVTKFFKTSSMSFLLIPLFAAIAFTNSCLFMFVFLLYGFYISRAGLLPARKKGRWLPNSLTPSVCRIFIKRIFADNTFWSFSAFFVLLQFFVSNGLVKHPGLSPAVLPELSFGVPAPVVIAFPLAIPL